MAKEGVRGLYAVDHLPLYFSFEDFKKTLVHLYMKILFKNRNIIYLNSFKIVIIIFPVLPALIV